MTDRKNIEKTLEKEHIKVYFIGIGGIGMSALAELCLDRGYTVFGSDREASGITERLIAMGADIKYAPRSENITDTAPDITVYTLSISADNPEYRKSLACGILTVSRAEFLGALMKRFGSRVGVSGSHGKSTVTAMLQHILTEAGLDPTAVGGALFSSGSSYVKGSDTHLVYEACEYGDSFLRFLPSVQVMLNLDFDHADYFEDTDALKRSFTAAANLASRAVVINADCENLSSIIDNVKAPVYSFSRQYGYIYRYAVRLRNNGMYSFDLFKHEKFLESFSLNIIGEFNVENAVAAAVASDILGVPPSVSRRALSSFSGISRRLEKIGSRKGVDLFYDYAHHPKEIAAMHKALCDAGYKSVAAVFCPHTYTRTKALFDEFADALGKFSLCLITQIYAAREAPLPGVTSQVLAERIRKTGGRAKTCTESTVCEYINEESIDCLVLLGAGNLDSIKERIKGE